MGARDIRLDPITPQRAHGFVRRHHYSGSSVRNSQIHVGVFYEGRLEGAIQLGPPLDRSKLIGLVDGSEARNMIELNRMVLTDRPPRNSESRALGVLVRLLRRHYPSLKWMVSFADASQCGDGTMYRASGFVLTGIRATKNLARLPGGRVIHKMTLESGPNRPRPELGGRSYFDITGGRYDFAGFVDILGGAVLPGHQLRYVRFIDPEWSHRLTVAEIPFERIHELGIGMYRGERVGSIGSDAPADPGGNEGGATPTPALQ